VAHDIALALSGLGVGVTVLSCVGAVLMRSSVFDRMHFVTPVTSVACPLVAIGLCVEEGWGLTAALLLFIAGLLFVVGPVLEAAMGRLVGQIEEKIPPSSPE
jgi:multicomponent Na+:H+ antiporter subunit G